MNFKRPSSEATDSPSMPQNKNAKSPKKLKSETTLENMSNQDVIESVITKNEDYPYFEIVYEKEEKVTSNPWEVSSPSDFLKYCCPECDFKSEELQLFSQHRFQLLFDTRKIFCNV